MSHAICHLDYHCSTSEKAILKDLNSFAYDPGQLAGNIISNITQIIEGFKGSTGIDPTSLLSGMLGAKMIDNNN